MGSQSWKMEVGINNVQAYQVSGRPYASGTINASDPTYVTFPYVTRWVYVINYGATDCKVGFSEAGVNGGTNYFRVPRKDNQTPGYSQRLELKVTQLWMSGSPEIDIVAGLTTIPSQRTSGSDGPSFSGSVGVG